MGDRSVTYLTDGNEITPGIYTHWAGSETADMIKAAAPLLRSGDPSYAAARLCGAFHAHLGASPLGLGLLPAPTVSASAMTAEAWSDLSRGDAGVFVINVTTGKVDTYDQGADNGFTIKLADV